MKDSLIDLSKKLLNDLEVAYSVGQRKATGRNIHTLGNKVYGLRARLQNNIKEGENYWFNQIFKGDLDRYERMIAVDIAKVEKFESFVNNL
tara:strand:+ start:718 stop:990 length:273 start_codon:yes stop_codon:yes gene_type:complete